MIVTRSALDASMVNTSQEIEKLHHVTSELAMKLAAMEVDLHAPSQIKENAAEFPKRKTGRKCVS